LGDFNCEAKDSNSPNPRLMRAWSTSPQLDQRM
jgi:hypothetical protein